MNKNQIFQNYDCLLKKTTEFMKDFFYFCYRKRKKIFLKLKIKLSKIKKYYYLMMFVKQSTLKEITKVLYDEGNVENVYALTITKTTSKKDSI